MLLANNTTMKNDSIRLIGEQVRRDIEQLQRAGFEIRKYTHEETMQRLRDMPKQIKQRQLPLSMRLEQVRKVDAIVAEKKCYKMEACEIVGITAGNYKQIKRLYGDRL